MSRIDESFPFKPVRIAVLTVSDTRTPKEDKSGGLLAEMLQADGHELAARAIVNPSRHSSRRSHWPPATT